jgi:predicted metal-dependent hydrolase
MPPFSACSEPRQRQVSWMSVGYKIQYRTQPIEFTVVRRERRTMQISVLPDSSVEVVAPVSVNEKDIVTRMHKRAGWIHKQMRFFQQYQPRLIGGL